MITVILILVVMVAAILCFKLKSANAKLLHACNEERKKTNHASILDERINVLLTAVETKKYGPFKTAGRFGAHLVV